MKLNLKENSIMAYLEKAVFIKDIIMQKLNFEERKSTEFINVSTEIIEKDSLKD